MKICFVVPAVYPLFDRSIKTKRRFGGAEKQIFLLSRALAGESGLEINCCVADFGQEHDVSEIDGVKMWKSFSYNEGKISGFLKLYRTLKNINADLYIFRSADIGVAMGIFIAKLILRKKVLHMIAHDAECSFSSLVKMSGYPAAFTMGPAYRMADIITAQSNDQMQLFHRHRKRKPSSLIRNIYNFTDNTAEENTVRDSVLWIGRCEIWKNPELFIRLAGCFPDTQFVMICPKVAGNEKYWDIISASAGKYQNMQFSEYVSPSEIGECYKRAMIYVMTSEFEGFSNTMMEAMNYSCPILSLFVNPDTILTENGMGFCAEGDFELLKEKFTILLSDEQLNRRMGENARDYLRASHSAKTVLSDFKRLIGNT